MYKKSIFMFLSLFFLVSCQKEPDLNEMDNEYMVYTQNDTSFSPEEHSTFYIPDSILVISYSDKPEYMYNNISGKLIDAYVSNMEQMGYSRVTEKENADLGIQLSYISDTHYFTGYVSSPYWWWGYPGYWDPFYWGSWIGWGYSFSINYSYSENSLLAEMVDLKSVEDKKHKLPVVWNAYISGDLSGYTHFDVNRMLRGIDRTFGQSPYLKK